MHAKTHRDKTHTGTDVGRHRGMHPPAPLYMHMCLCKMRNTPYTHGPQPEAHTGGYAYTHTRACPHTPPSARKHTDEQLTTMQNQAHLHANAHSWFLAQSHR